MMADGRAPHGARGLKHPRAHAIFARAGTSRLQTLRHGRHGEFAIFARAGTSRPSRGAWIETLVTGWIDTADIVAPLTGRVD